MKFKKNIFKELVVRSVNLNDETELQLTRENLMEQSSFNNKTYSDYAEYEASIDEFVNETELLIIKYNTNLYHAWFKWAKLKDVGIYQLNNTFLYKNNLYFVTGQHNWTIEFDILNNQNNVDTFLRLIN